MQGRDILIPRPQQRNDENPKLRPLEKNAFFADKGVSNWGVAHASTTEADMWTEDELKRAAEEDRMLQRLLDDASNQQPRPMSTPESIAAGAAAIAEGRKGAAETLARRIENKVLLSADELREALGIAQAEIHDAVEANRLFAFEGPGGELYYPAFYTDANLDKSALGMVVQEMRDLPAASKYHFFISKRTNLGETPLEALRRGRVAEVLRAARGFAIS